MDNSPPHSLVMVVVGVVEVRDDPSWYLEGLVHKDCYLHSLVNSRDSFVGHVVVLIFGGIVHMKVVDGLWLMDFSRHMFNVIDVAGSTILVNNVLSNVEIRSWWRLWSNDSKRS
jgi:hypothetical protein